MSSFEAINKQIKDAFPAGKALPVYDRGFRDSMESMVLAMRAFRVSPSIVQDVVTTAMDAFGNNAPDGARNDTTPKPRVFGTERDAAEKAAAKADLFTKTDATGLLFFQALQDQWRLEIPLDKAQITSSMTTIVTSTVELANQALAASMLHPLNYAGLVEKAVMEHDYECLVHAKPNETTPLAPFDSVGFKRIWGDNTVAKIADSLAQRFDYIHRANDPSVNRVWLARLCDESPQPHEWGMHRGLVGVAMPDEMFQFFLAEAAERARQADIEQPGADAAPAPGQGA